MLISVMQSFAVNFLPYYPVLSLAELSTLEPAMALAFSSTEMLPPTNTLPKPLAQLVVCSIAALSKEVPRRVAQSLFRSLRFRLDGDEGNRLMRRSCMGNVQTLLLLSVSAELHDSSTSEGGSRSWLTLGTAVRMAFDLVRLCQALGGDNSLSGLASRHDQFGSPSARASPAEPYLGCCSHCRPLVFDIFRTASID